MVIQLVRIAQELEVPFLYRELLDDLHQFFKTSLEKLSHGYIGAGHFGPVRDFVNIGALNVEPL